MSRLFQYRCILVMLLLGGLLPATAIAELTPQEERGKVIYLQGETASGAEITALMGDPGTEVPASVIPCGSCHGHDGRGRPEGGVYPSNLTWTALTKPYGLDHPTGRKHPPYTERNVKRAITMGIDPAGNRLHIAMPRYQLTYQDAEDLVSYIQRLGEDLDPGLSEDTIRLATILPREGPMASLGMAIEAALRACFDDVNQQGGIYHRRIELTAVAGPQDAGERAAALRQTLEAGETFALVGAFLPGAEAELAAVVQELETPLIGPFTIHPQVDFFVPNPYVFYLLPGLEDLALALTSFAADRSDGEPTPAAVVRSSEARLDTTTQGIVERAADLGWPAVKTAVLDGDSEIRELRDAGVGRVFLLASGDRQAAFFRRAAALEWFPEVLLPGTLAGREIFAAPPGFADRLFAAYPTLPSSQDPRSVRNYRELAERYDLPRRHVAAQIATLGAAQVLIEGLKRTGRDLSRAGLVEALESLVDLDTGLLPPVTYGPNRRVGIQGAYVVAIDLERQTLVPASGWVRSR